MSNTTPTKPPTAEERAYELCPRACEHLDPQRYSGSCGSCVHAKAEIEAAEAQAREPLEQEIELREESRQRIEKVLLYVLFVLTGSEEVKTDLCDSVQMAADNTKHKRDALRGEVGRLKKQLAYYLDIECADPEDRLVIARRGGAREALERAAKAVRKLSKMPSAYEDAIRALGEREEEEQT